jgi:2-methylcitrate dehydratase PrpD
MPTAAERLAAFAAALRPEDVPPAVLDAAALHLLDALGCGLAAHGVGVGGEARAAVLEDGTSGPSTVIGVAHGLPPAEAALANGALCHALDFDDTDAGALVHVSVVVGPAALALAEAREASGADLLAAFVAGTEVTARLGRAASGAFHARGLHATAICGVHGAAAAAARLLGLDAAATVHALGIAGSLGSGLLEFLEDGSATKRLHPGWAAHAGLHAARLAARGATGPATVYEGRFGVFRALADRAQTDLEAQLATLERTWLTPASDVKAFPACHYVHGALGAAAQVLEDGPLDPGAVEDVLVFLPGGALPIVAEPAEAKRRPRSDYEAKFSVQYAVAAMLVHGRADVRTFAQPAIADPDVLALAARVRHEEKAYATYPGAFPGGVEVRLRDGRVLRAELEHQPGGAAHPLPPEAIREKFARNAALVLAPERAAELEEAVLGLLERRSVAGALAALGAASAGALSGAASP